jgi:hypothetical protein
MKDLANVSRQISAAGGSIFTPRYAIHAKLIRGIHDLPTPVNKGASGGEGQKAKTMTAPIKAMISASFLVFSASGAMAQEVTNRVAADTDWAVFEGEGPKECWAVTAPKETTNTRDGRSVSVRRGDILLFVTYRPAQNIAGEVSFTGGYPFAEGSTVTMEVAGSSFELFSEGEYAWPATPAEDQKIVTAMKRGANAVLTARSSRGTQTKDTFSLLGATAMIEQAETNCAG